MSLPLILTALVSISMSVVLLLSLTDVNAVTVNNTHFSVNVLDNWAYRETNDPISVAFGRGPELGLVPSEFNDFLLNTSKVLSGEEIQNEGAYSIISLDTDYPYRNVPLETYTQYNINLSKVKIFSKENTTIDGEPAVKIHRTARNNLTNLEVTDYYIVHNSKPYFLQYAANVKDFQKYLPQFEQMVKTFKFVK